MSRTLPAVKPTAPLAPVLPSVAETLRDGLFAFAPAALIEALFDRMEARA